MAEQISETRLKFRGRLGEIVDKVMGISAVREIFEAADKGDEQATAKIEKAKEDGKGRPAVAVLLDEFVPKPLQHALTAAQAAERALVSIEALEEFYQTHVSNIKNIVVSNKDTDHAKRKKQLNAYYEASVSLPNTNDPSFKFIGTTGDAPYLIRAQATHQLMTEYERNEKIGMKYELLNSAVKIGNFEVIGSDYLDGFKWAMVQALKESAQVMDKAGYQNAAVEILTIAEDVLFDEEKAAQYTPQKFAENAVSIQERLTQNENNMYVDNLSVRRIVLDVNWQNTMIKRASQAMGLAA